jgi:hypothetical protein
MAQCSFQLKEQAVVPKQVAMDQYSMFEDLYNEHNMKPVAIMLHSLSSLFLDCASLAKPCSQEELQMLQHYNLVNYQLHLQTDSRTPSPH